MVESLDVYCECLREGVPCHNYIALYSVFTPRSIGFPCVCLMQSLCLLSPVSPEIRSILPVWAREPWVNGALCIQPGKHDTIIKILNMETLSILLVLCDGNPYQIVIQNLGDTFLVSTNKLLSFEMPWFSCDTVAVLFQQSRFQRIPDSLVNSIQNSQCLLWSYE